MAEIRKGTQRMRLVLCGICFKADCPLSKWIMEGDGDLVLEDALDEMREVFFQCQHDELEILAASKRTVEQTEAIEVAEEQKLSDIFGGEIKIDRETRQVEIITDKGSFLDDIIAKYSEHIPVQSDDKKQKEH
jgi:hypothetical protein